MDKVASENRDAEKMSRKVMTKNRITQHDDSDTVKENESPDIRIHAEDVNTGWTGNTVFFAEADLFSFTAQESGVETGAEEELLLVDEKQAQEALELVTGVFSELSEVLGVRFFNGSEQFSLREISGETKAQFAEIIHVLRTMASAMEMSAADGLPVELPGKSIGGEELAALTDTIRTAVFRMEMACNVLGISEAVSGKIASTAEGVDPLGIVQATDPATLSMSPQHVRRLFGSMFGEDSESSEAGTLVEKVRKLLSGTVSGEVKVSASVQASEIRGQMTDADRFESQVYRALLKIDALHKVGSENAAAGGDGGDEKTAMINSETGLLFADTPGESVSQDDITVTGIESVKPGQPFKMAETKNIPDALMRMTEESVTKQVVEKLNSVVRSGLSEVRIQLRPESLGEVRMRISMEGDVVFARIEVQNQQVKEIMERNFGTLKDALEQHNITAGNFDVQVGGENGRNGGHAFREAWFDGEQEDEFGHSGRERHEEQEPEEQLFTRKTDTGRRFGDNSIEYYG